MQFGCLALALLFRAHAEGAEDDQSRILAPETTCSGFDEEWGPCPHLPPCSKCEPIDCQFANWGEWYPTGGCTGLLFRQRSVAVSNNECGTPCDGDKMDSKPHIVPECQEHEKDCAMSAWSEWTKCGSPTDQSYRTRSISQEPMNGGKTCSGDMKATRPCGHGTIGKPCELAEWSDWTTCSATCGTGRHTRMRRVSKEPEHGGQPCLGMLLMTQSCEMQACPSQDCSLSEWSSWSYCDGKARPQRYRSRHVMQNAFGNGKRCDEALKETEGCAMPHESKEFKFSPWSDWHECDKTCDGGQTSRMRRMIQAGTENEGTCASTVLQETKPCRTQPCFVKTPGDCETSAWSSWSDCSTDCGKGSRSRSRNVTKSAKDGGKGCEGSMAEVVPCVADKCDSNDCRWSDWFDWSGCSCTCGGGTKRRSRVVASAPIGAGKLCEALDKSEAAPCNTQPCKVEDCVDGAWGNWDEWSTCSATCSSGFRSRHRALMQEPNYCGKPAAGLRQEFEACSDLPACMPSKDCEVSEWGDWSFCSCTCLGIRERNRFIKQFASGEGKPCSDMSLKEIHPCNPQGGEKMPQGCGLSPPVDCKLSVWGEWGACTKLCGGGQKERVRKVLVEPENGGKLCDSALVISAPCNTKPCGEEVCVDCTWGEWGEWGDCSKCGGQRYRHRAIEKLPNHCGKMCDLKSAKEMSNCTSHCTEELFCAWTEWSALSGCSSSCGPSTEMRNRALGIHSKKPSTFFFEASEHEQCVGTQLDMTRCQQPDSCKAACIPQDCVFGQWDDWGAPSCTGLCERGRVIDKMNNECGTPCSGSLLETKRCAADCQKAVDCVVSSWSEWSTDECTKEGGQKYRVRTVEQMPEKDGRPCSGPMHETTTCSVTMVVRPCVVSSWSEWTACQRTCGGGTQTRARRVTEHSVGGGAPCSDSLEELRGCSMQKCEAHGKTDCILSDWEEWSECGGGCGGPNQRDRKRQIVQLAEGGAPCAGHLEETKTCGFEEVDCVVSQWTNWDICDKTCGGGQQHRQREIQVFSANGGKSCPPELIQTQGCNMSPCGRMDCEVGEWTHWSTCSATCGAGQQTRTRDILHDRSAGGIGCLVVLSQTKPCAQGGAHGNPPCDSTDCVWGQWSEWSGCSCSCAGGQKTRNRHIAKAPRNNGKPCKPEDKEEIIPCNTQPCSKITCQDGEWDEWVDWSPCSATCGGGVTFRIRKIAKMANHCGNPPEGLDRESKFCNAHVSCEKAVDCEFSEWGTWSDCSTSCNGIKRRSRRIGRYGRGDGAYCIGTLKETSSCNPDIEAGEKIPQGCGVESPVDCVLGDWQEWSGCTATCGGGSTSRSRNIVTQPAHGGIPCEGPLSEAKECARASCPGPHEVDCQFGDWEDWAACGKCGGQRKRYRRVLQYASEGGVNCEAFAHEDTGSCPRKCHTKLYCTWTGWKEWSSCTSTCGEGKRSRRRYLSLSEAKSDPPEPLTIRRYSELFQRTEQARTGHMSDLLIAFFCGCLSFVVALGSIRAFAVLRHAPRRDTQENPLHQQDGESELPLVGESL